MLYASVKEQLKITFFRSKQDVFKYRACPDDMCNKLQVRLIHMHFQLIHGAKIFIFDCRIYCRNVFFNENEMTVLREPLKNLINIHLSPIKLLRFNL